MTDESSYIFIWLYILLFKTYYGSNSISILVSEVTTFEQAMAGMLGNSVCQNMDPRSLKHVTGIPIRSTKGLLLSKPYQPHYNTLSTAASKINGLEREDSFAVWIKNYVSLGPKLIEIMKLKLSYGATIIQFGSQDKLFRKNFSTKEKEKLLQASQCHLYTTAGAIAGFLFVSTERVAFCSHKSIKTYSTTGKLLKFQYKVSIPLEKISGVNESRNMKRASNNYMELVTVDDFSFWFMGFINYKKTLRYLRHAITDHVCLSN
ncbi:putative GEM-like protein [Helianthus debilis subsp. tardiflorus]